MPSMARQRDEHPRACSRMSVASAPWARPVRVWAAGPRSCMRAACWGAAAAGCYLRRLHVRQDLVISRFHTRLVPVCGQGIVLTGPGRRRASGRQRHRCRRPQDRASDRLSTERGRSFGGWRSAAASGRSCSGSRARRRAAATTAWRAPGHENSLMAAARFCDRHRHCQG
jgi:hypothetical protein